MDFIAIMLACYLFSFDLFYLVCTITVSMATIVVHLTELDTLIMINDHNNYFNELKVPNLT